jgi:hypothetical protein
MLKNRKRFYLTVQKISTITSQKPLLEDGVNSMKRENTTDAPPSPKPTMVRDNRRNQ